jgi:DNA-nicking Smr family endonuclease
MSELVADESPEGPAEPVAIPITGELDLHTFSPKDLKELIPAYFEACREKGLLTVRIVHGKGIGQLRQTVHAMLAKLPEVESYVPANELLGSWGATMVRLKPGPPSAAREHV